MRGGKKNLEREERKRTPGRQQGRQELSKPLDSKLGSWRRREGGISGVRGKREWGGINPFKKKFTYDSENMRPGSLAKEKDGERGGGEGTRKGSFLGSGNSRLKWVGIR